MARIARGFVLMLAALAIVGSAHAAGALTDGDYGWLGANLTIARGNSTIVALTEAQQARLHALIGGGKGGVDRRRQAVVEFLNGAAGASIEQTLEQAQRPVAAPREAESALPASH